MSLTRRTLLAAAATAPALIGWKTSAAQPISTTRFALTTTRRSIMMSQHSRSWSTTTTCSSTPTRRCRTRLRTRRLQGAGVQARSVRAGQPVRRAWGDTALVAGLVRLSWTLKGEHQARLLRIAHVWTKLEVAGVSPIHSSRGSRSNSHPARHSRRASSAMTSGNSSGKKSFASGTRRMPREFGNVRSR